MKDITDVTIVDGSTRKGEEQQVSAKMSMFVDAGAKGTALLESMQEAYNANAPVAMYGLTCVPQGMDKHVTSNLASCSFEKRRVALTPSWAVCKPRPTR